MSYQVSVVGSRGAARENVTTFGTREEALRFYSAIAESVLRTGGGKVVLVVDDELASQIAGRKRRSTAWDAAVGLGTATAILAALWGALFLFIGSATL